MNKAVTNPELTCTVSFYEDSYQFRRMVVQLPETDTNLFDAISNILDDQEDYRPTNGTLWAVVQDEDGNEIYRCTRGTGHGKLKVIDVTQIRPDYVSKPIEFNYLSMERREFNIIKEL